MTEILSGCAVRAAIQMEKIDSDAHYFKAIKFRLEQLYELTEAPNLREQISDEVDWINSKLGESMTDRPYGEAVTVRMLAEFLHGDQPLMLGGRSQPLSVYLEFAKLILSEFNMQRKQPPPRS
jgi:hypothetical protein